MPKSRIFTLVFAVLGFLLLWFLIGHIVSWRSLFATLVILFVVLFIVRHFGQRLLIGLYAFINRFVPWEKLPPLIGTLNLDANRIVLRQKNLHDTPAKDMPPPQWKPSVRCSRTADGAFNDLNEPNMGRAGMRFGRNVPLKHGYPENDNQLLTPNPRLISRKLMTRDVFQPVESLNLLAAAWIQFMVHGWVNHQKDKEKLYKIDIAADDSWHENPMRISKTRMDSEATDKSPPTYVNTESHWWDASQIYGSNQAAQNAVRSFEDGKLSVDVSDKFGDFRLLQNEDSALSGIDQTGFFDNYWMGLSIFHTLFTVEHNAICDRLKAEYPGWNDEQLFNTARLINAALLAKIHTVEWTPGILGHPTLQVSMEANWWGLFGERFKKAFGRIGDGEELSGIIGSPTDHHAASYAMTEEFTAIYRLHPLLPDEYKICSRETGALIKNMDLVDIQGNGTRTAMDDIAMADLFYSFGIQHPGALRLHNYPKALQRIERIDGEILDLAAVDILRDRERGVPRYNEYRKLCHMKPVKTFEELTDNKEWAEQIKSVYQGQIDRVDLMVGMMAEPLPKGFGFSDTRFRIFILMASRRLKSDRFFTTDYTPEVYTQLGLDWIDQNNFSSVLLRHYPQLAPALQGVNNSFSPWASVTKTKPS